MGNSPSRNSRKYRSRLLTLEEIRKIFKQYEMPIINKNLVVKEISILNHMGAGFNKIIENNEISIYTKENKGIKYIKIYKKRFYE